MRAPTPSPKLRSSARPTGAKGRGPGKPKPQKAGRPTVQELTRRKGLVMQVATELFVQNGYADTSLVDIAKAAGVATRTLYQHFGDKEGIFLEVVTARESGAVFEPPVLADDVTLFEAMMHMARYIREVSFRPRSIDLMRLVVAESQRFPEFMMSLCDKTFAHFRATIAKMFDELAARKLIPAGDSTKTAILFIDLILGTAPLLVYAGWTSSRPTDTELETKVELFIAGRFGAAVAKRARTAKPAKRSAAAKPVAPAGKRGSAATKAA
jgi:TetR/AcrR family transcriptional repressor of mexJK operon